MDEVIKSSGLPELGTDDLHRIFDAAPALIAVHEGPDHVFVYSNPPHDRAVGGRDLIGRPLREAMSDLHGQGVFERFDRVWQSGEAFKVPEFAVTFDRDGSGALTEGHFRQVLQPWRGPDGTVRGVVSLSYDITEQVEARERAEDSEARMRRVFDSIDQGYCLAEMIVDDNGAPVDYRFLEVNPLFEQMTGLKDATGRTAMELVPELEHKWVEHYARAGLGGESLRFQDDSEAMGRVFDVFATPVVPKGRCAIVFKDITVQHATERKLRESEARLDSILSNATVAVFLMNDRQECVYMNAAAERLTGYSLAETCGRPLHDVVHHKRPDGTPYPLSECPIDQALPKNDREQGEEVFVHKDGSFYPVAFTASPTRDETGCAVGTVIEVRDIRAEKQAEAALRESEAEFRTITEAMPQIVWATRPDGYHDFYNSRWYTFTGVPEGSTDGEGWNDLFHPDDQERAWASWRHSLATGEPYEIEYRLRHHRKGYRWVLGRAEPVRSNDGQILRWLGTCTDIHALKEAEAQRKLMLAEMNHRVKNTLTMVHAVVMQTLRGAEDLESARTTIQHRVGSLASAHDRLVHTDWNQADVREIVEAALAPHRTGEGRFTLEGQSVTIGSRQALALTMTLHELATNATKYGAASVENGRIDISWSISNDGNADSPQTNRDADYAGTFRITWNERNGPPVSPPARRGFGSRMIERALASYFDGHAELFYDPEGLRFELTAPSSGLTR